MTNLPAAARPGLGLLARSWRMLAAHPVVGAALGAAVLLSFASMLFGVGVLVTPWFVCEIFALQLAILTDRPTARSLAWVRAAALVLAMTGVVVAATFVAALAIGPDVSTADAAVGPLPWPDALGRVALIAAVTALAVGFIAPFQYAPLLLIDRGGALGAALLESAWLVRRGGLARHFALAFAAHLLPLLPALVAAVVVARTFERAATPLGVLAGLPLMPFSIPLGQGILSAAYVARHAELAEPRWARREAKPPRRLVALLCASVALPMLGVLALAFASLRPAPASVGPAPGGEVVLDRAVEATVELHVPNTTLCVRASPGEVVVVASDGAEARLRARWRAPVERVRVVRRGERYAVEARGDAWAFIVVDAAAVRTDDAIADRIERRLPRWGLPALGLSFALCALLVIRALEPLGRVRRLYAAPASERPSARALRAERARAQRRAWVIGLVLIGPALAAFAAGALALAG
ncbi:MAG: hypothetical protein KF729_06515 [Sandaracinaceae bacterium]|nr:hypothetical protein [Sandaracinaceae bacterium]